MKTGTREAMVISEVLRSNSSMIDHYNLYLNSCQDQQLRSILERQQRHTMDSFQRLVQMAQNHGMDTSRMPLPSSLSMTMGVTPNTQYGSQMQNQQYATGQYSGASQFTSSTSYAANTPGMGTQMTGQTNQMGMQSGMMNDRVIAEGALLFHKFGADQNTKAALESAEPHLRNALTNMARNCIEMSYEVYNFMAQRGWYQLPQSQPNFITHSPTQQQQTQYPPQ